MADWRQCIVTTIDLIGVRRLAQSSGGSLAMRRLHQVADEVTADGLPAIDHVYAWNDAILLLSFLEGGTARSSDEVIRDAMKVKDAASKICSTYAVSVRGKAFPTIGSKEPRPNGVTIIQASSWALANCFEIARELKGLRMQWYIDGRIVRDTPFLRGNESDRRKVRMLPTGRSRYVHVFKHHRIGSSI